MPNGIYPHYNFRFPLNPKDGDQIADIYGNIFEYDLSDKTWNAKGVLRIFPVVNEKEDGLVSPDIFDKLDVVRGLIQQGVKFDAFKIRVDSASPYYYYFHSSDRLISFKTEQLDSELNLRIEVDKARLYHNILSRCCLGPKGLKGETGDKGKDGEPAKSEVFLKPSVIQPDTLKVTVPVNTPIDTNISLRFFLTQSSSDFVTEFIIPLNGEEAEVSVIDQSIGVDASSSVKFMKGVVQATVKLTGKFGDLTSWRYKVRQKGKKGKKGNDGSRFLEVVTSFFDDSSIRATSAVVSARKSPVNDNVYLVKNKLPDEVCASLLTPSSDSLPIGLVTEALFAAVLVTMKSCKDVCAFQFKRPEFTVPELSLPQWTPMSCCTGANYRPFEFNWPDFASPAVPFQVLQDPPPPEQCCQNEMFNCNNVGDNQCGIEGQLGPPARIPLVPTIPEGGYYSSPPSSPDVCKSFEPWKP
jgi:hypothetical protein